MVAPRCRWMAGRIAAWAKCPSPTTAKRIERVMYVCSADVVPAKKRGARAKRRWCARALVRMESLESESSGSDGGSIGTSDAEQEDMRADIGSYQLERVLGEGGMGVVYLAEHRVLKRRVAIKVLAPSPTMTMPAALQRFLDEAQA